ncbi:E3 ubiquitin-protein ligase Midline-1 [Oncorhynchus mykiss]|uniref:E3 ubiquitin-protein ligase Midline-1 n=1 Tax=Oncorhynchus mykiss TaxID=8022 RepID=UPI000B4E99AB|nr:E3 ubiquitin-protein ligase Midline-1 [Oncorhynchus mykiss]
MEVQLGKELSCPVCLDVFSPPVIELCCSHNYCKKCIHQTLIAQNCNKPQDKFICPMCRKVNILPDKGLNGLKRNMFVENVVAILKERTESNEAKQQALKEFMCPDHNEIMNLVCLQDNTLICAGCKLFGHHSTHAVSKLFDVYEQRKEGFAKQMKSLLDKHEANKKCIEGLVGQKQDLLSSSKDIEAFLKKLGDSLIWEIQRKVSHMVTKVHTECSMRCRCLQDGMDELSAPQKVHTEMKKHVDGSKSPVDFLKGERRLHREAEKVLEPVDWSAQYRESISLGQYVEDLMSGIDIRRMGTVRGKSLVKNISQDLKAWRSGRTSFDPMAYRSLDVMLTKTASLVEQGEDDSDDSDSDTCLSWETHSTSEEEGATGDTKQKA